MRSSWIEAGAAPVAVTADCRSESGGYDDKSGKEVSIDSSSGVNVGRMGERMC